MKILLVDKDVTGRMALQDKLSREGHETFGASVLDMAFLTIQGNSDINLIITALDLAQGREGLDLLGGIGRRRKKRIILVLERTMPKIAEEAFSLGAEAVVNRDELLKHLKVLRITT